MTTPQTPQTAAGRRLSDLIASQEPATVVAVRAAILAIEAEARVDALRDAAERVRALRVAYAADAMADGYLQTRSRTELIVATLDSVLAILDPKAAP
jgi:hypothetical protein